MKRRRGWPTGQLAFIALLGLGALLAHLVDGYAWCQEYWNWDGKRHSSTDGRRWPANDGVVITYINGIFHSVPEWESITQQLQALFGHEVRPFYNPSSGWWITDASKAGYHLLRKPANHTIAQALGDHLAQAVEDVGRGRVLHIAHSGGALITYLAAQHHLTRRQRDKIDVLAFGGARSITRKYFSGLNYYARNDPLVKLDRRAAELMKLTNNTKFQEINEKHNTTFVFLEGRARQFVLDHSLEGPTYQHALRKEAKGKKRENPFRRAHFGPLSPLAWDYEQSILRLFRKKVAQLSGLHDFFSTERFGLRSIRKSVARLTGLHGFFSGKNPGSKGVAVSVFGSGKEAAGAEAEGSGVSTGVTSWWKPWGRRSDSGNDIEVVVVPEAAAAAGAEGGAPGVGATGERFWLGFRWSRRGRKGQGGDEAEEGAGPTGSVVVDLDERSPISMDVENGQAQEPRSTSRWARVRGAWAFGRAKESIVAGELAASEDGGLSDSSVEATAEEEAGGKGGLDSSPLAESSDRPWLSVGWTPWGGRTTRQPPGKAGDAPASAPASPPESRVEEATLSTEHGEDAAGEGEAATSAADTGGAAGVAPAVGEKAGGFADGARIVAAGSADVSTDEAEKALPSRDDSSYLRRWWPSSSSSSSSSSSGGIGSTIGVPEEADGGGDPGGGESVVAGASVAAKEEQAIVSTSPGNGGEESLEATERDAAEGGVEPFPGTGGEQAERPEGPITVEQEQEVSLSLLRRWWPVSKQEPTSPDEARVEEDSLDGVTEAANATRADVGPEVGVLSTGLAHASADGDASGPQKLPAEQLPELLSAQPGRGEEGVEEEQQQGSRGGGSSAPAARPPLVSRFWDVFFNRPLELPLPTTQEESLDINVSADGGGSDALATTPDSEGSDVAAAKSAEGGGAEAGEMDGGGGESNDDEIIVTDLLRPADGVIPPPPRRIDDLAQTPSSVEEGARDEVTPKDDEGPVGEEEEKEERREDERGAGKEGIEDRSPRIEEQDKGPSEGRGEGPSEARDADSGSGGEDLGEKVQPVGQRNEAGVIPAPAKKERVVGTGNGSGRR
ncbi:unnamed protein product [Ectocarpus fasciculatus]